MPSTEPHGKLSSESSQLSLVSRQKVSMMPVWPGWTGLSDPLGAESSAPPSQPTAGGTPLELLRLSSTSCTTWRKCRGQAPTASGLTWEAGPNFYWSCQTLLSGLPSSCPASHHLQSVNSHSTLNSQHDSDCSCFGTLIIGIGCSGVHARWAGSENKRRACKGQTGHYETLHYPEMRLLILW